MAEDAASNLGLIIATLGVAGSAGLGWLWADGAAAIAIGLLLVGLTGVVIAETYSLLTGEAALPSTIDAARSIFEEDPSVDRVCEVLSMQLGPDEILMAATLNFSDTMTAREFEEAADALSDKSSDPRTTRAFIRPGRFEKKSRRFSKFFAHER